MSSTAEELLTEGQLENIDISMFDIRLVPIDQVKIDPPETNPRLHTEESDRVLDTSVGEFGGQRGIVIDEDGNSLAGTGVLEAMKRKGATHVITLTPKDPRLKDKVLIAKVASDLTPEQQDRYRAVDNIAGEAGGWNHAVIEQMRDRGDLSEYRTHVDRILAARMHTDGEGSGGGEEDKDKGARVDEAAELAKKWGVRPGQIWEIPSQTARGDAHRIMCGDAAVPDDVEALMGGTRARGFFSDPPYAVDYDGSNHPHQWAGRSEEREKLREKLPEDVVAALDVQHDEVGEEEFDAGAVPDGLPVDVLTTAAFEEEFYGEWDKLTPEEAAKLWLDTCQLAVSVALMDDAAWYWCHASKHQALVEKIWNQVGAFMHQQIIWAKNRPVFTRSWAMWQHEPIMMGWKRGNRPPRVTKQYERTLWQIDTIPPGQHGLHPTEKPPELFARMMRQHCRPGEVCYEPFGGSHAQMVAGEACRVIVFSMEKNPKWVAVGLQRAADMGLHPAIVQER